MDGYQISLDIVGGLPYLQCCKPKDEEVTKMKLDLDWNPSIYDHRIDEMDKFHDETTGNVEYGNFDQYGKYCHHTVAIHNLINDVSSPVPFDYYDAFIDALLCTEIPTVEHQSFAIKQNKVIPDF
jgi:hypothetical protein